MSRVIGIDPGTVSFDICGLENGRVFLDTTLPSKEFAANPQALIDILTSAQPVDLIAAPSGYGLPLVPIEKFGDQERFLFTLVDERERERIPVLGGMGKMIPLMKDCGLPLLFIPGVIHLPTVPRHRKANKLDMGTADKLCCLALGIYDQARHLDIDYQDTSFILAEVGGAYTAVMAVEWGQVTDGLGGTTAGPGYYSLGGMDGELAYLLAGFPKEVLFSGEAAYMADRPDLSADDFFEAAQGAALLADGLAGGRFRKLVEVMEIEGASGTVLDHKSQLIRKAARAAQGACLLEVAAPKPGNVHPGVDFSDTCLEDFLLSALAIGPAMEKADRNSVGRIILEAVEETQKTVRSNTNLGMVLLLAPLAKACSYGLRIAAEDFPEDPGENLWILPCCEKLRKTLAEVLSGLTVKDARLAYEAVRLAGMGGLGQVNKEDVSQAPSIALYQAMELARDRDSIAREYVTDFAITFQLGYPTLKETGQTADSLTMAIVQTYLTILKHVPDTLIARKRGMKKARQVSGWAGEVLSPGGVYTPEGKKKIEELDRSLRKEGNALNPGTTADLTAAAIFLFLLYDR